MLQLFFENRHALSPSSIETMLNNYFDKVTIYRTLTTFEECGILHRVPSDSGVVHYALCHSNCSQDRHRDEHVHFYCEDCDKTFCLHDTAVPRPTLPLGYEVRDWRFLFSGTCISCNTKS